LRFSLLMYDRTNEASSLPILVVVHWILAHMHQHPATLFA
jgi:hypothetical protein